jgi:aminopeptidase N
MKKIALLLLFAAVTASAQKNFTRKDSLQGGLRPERTNYDVQRYDLNITINPEERSIVGYNEITFKALPATPTIQIDLFDNMNVDSIVYEKRKLSYRRDNNAVFVFFAGGIQGTDLHKIRFYYSGNPLAARNAPWDGGFVFKKDKNDKDWIGVAVQGTGASLWYPCKDSQTDEPELGCIVKVAVPNGLMNVSNGRLTGSEDLKNGYTRWDWEVKNPINNYDVTVNIGDYVNIHDTHNGIDLDYYVLRDNEAKARVHFEEVKPMLDCFESKFGKYPFAEDSYKLVETSYLGMEHQSAIAYGNKYRKGYMGSDLSGTGIGTLFDYIIIHESGHEWFGNSITSKDIADMWIHEGFTMYSEVVFVECLYGYDKATEYMNGMKRNVANDKPVIGQYGVNNEGSGDMYYKGALMLHTIRHIINDDAKWWKTLLKFGETYRHQIIDNQTVVTFFNAETGMDLTPVFDQYLKSTTIPKLRLEPEKGKLHYQWENVGANFNMPVDINIGGKTQRIYPTTTMQTLSIPKKTPMSEIKAATSKFFIDVVKSW